MAEGKDGTPPAERVELGWADLRPALCLDDAVFFCRCTWQYHDDGKKEIKWLDRGCLVHAGIFAASREKRNQPEFIPAIVRPRGRPTGAKLPTYEERGEKKKLADAIRII
jgi:hypothetical protein